MNDDVGRPVPLEEGWYLMSETDLERELIRRRSPDGQVPSSNALRLATEEALEYRNAGNLPDENERSLRLVLHMRDASELRSLERKRLLYEPDFHQAPEWRVAGSRAVTVVPLRVSDIGAAPAEGWWEQPEVAVLEDEWAQRGTIGGVRVPPDYRGFVFKTVLSLRAAGKDVTASSIADSVQRWLPPDDASRIRSALEDTNRDA